MHRTPPSFLRPAGPLQYLRAIAAILSIATLPLAAGCANNSEDGSVDPGEDNLTKAAGRIVPQKSIAGVTLKMSEQEVRSILGKPDSTSKDHGNTALKFGETLVVFDLSDHGVIRVETRDARLKTAEGIGIGSTAAEFAAATVNVAHDCVSDGSSCWFGFDDTESSNDIWTHFSFSKEKRVQLVRLGFSSSFDLGGGSNTCGRANGCFGARF